MCISIGSGDVFEVMEELFEVGFSNYLWDLHKGDKMIFKEKSKINDFYLFERHSNYWGKEEKKEKWIREGMVKILLKRGILKQL